MRKTHVPNNSRKPMISAPIVHNIVRKKSLAFAFTADIVAVFFLNNALQSMTRTTMKSPKKQRAIMVPPVLIPARAKRIRMTKIVVVIAPSTVRHDDRHGGFRGRSGGGFTG